MKKIVLLIIPFLCLFGCTQDKYKEVSFKQLQNMIEKKESFVLFIGAKSCSHCDNYKTTINNVVKDYHVTIYYIDIDKLSQEENNKLKKIASYRGTPTTIFITKGKEKSAYTRIIGERDYDYVVNKLSKNGYIEKVKK